MYRSRKGMNGRQPFGQTEDCSVSLTVQQHSSQWWTTSSKNSSTREWLSTWHHSHLWQNQVTALVGCSMGPWYPPKTLPLHQGWKVHIWTADSQVLILLEGHIKMDPVKVTGIQEWLTPRNVTKVQSLWALSTSTGSLSKNSCTSPNPFISSQRRSVAMDWGPAESLWGT